MSGIAEVLINLGYPVSGSDLKPSPLTRRLKSKGARIFYGHKKDNVVQAEVVVTSSAIKPTNPEVVEAKNRNIPIIGRAEMLAELMRFSKYGVAVSGTHGKTTTTSLVASVLHYGGYDPTMIIGGKVNSLRSNARLGKGEFMVAEADESDGSFLKLSPSIAVVTNIDPEHMDFYKSFDRVKKAYLEFIHKIPFYGVAVVCVDHPVIEELLPKIEKRVLTYGFSEKAQFRAENIDSKNGHIDFDFVVFGEKKKRVSLHLIGHHNVLNALAALAVGWELGIPLVKAIKALKNFKGVQRRCQVLLQNNHYTVIDDYGHHPEEIKATLKAIRGAYTGRLVTLFQPHRYTRTRDMFKEFMAAFDSTNLLLVTDIYPAGEAPISGVHSKNLVEGLKKNLGEQVRYIPKTAHLVNDVLKWVAPGDILLSLGAGDVTKIGKECAKQFKKYGSTT